MKRAVFILIGFCSVVLSRGDEAKPSPVWLSDFPAAQLAAAQTHRPMLLNFTGSDWCVWCHRMRDEIFQTKVFADYAEAALVLVELDFPRRKSLPPEVQRQNRMLADRFGVEGYPTILLITAEGKVLARLGYMQGGPKTFVRELKRQIASAGAALQAKREE